MKNSQKQPLVVTLLLFLITLLPFHLLAQDTKNNYTIEGNTTKWASFTLQYTVDGKRQENTVEVKNGAFTISGSIETRQQAGLMMRPGNDGVGANGQRLMTSIVRFWLEPGHIQVNNLDSVGKISFSGSPLNDDQNELSRQKQKLSGVAVGKEHDEKLKNITINFVKTHTRSLVSLTELNYNLSRGIPDLSIVEPLFNGLSNDLKESPEGKAYQSRLDNWKKVDVGAIAPEFTQPNQFGKAVKLSDFKGKYVLLDFWASWCHPCREENPNLIKQYDLYKDKNFVILSISLDGGNASSKTNWLKAIKQDKVGIWPQLCDLSGDTKNNKVRLMYNVGSIPESFLIDPNGKIIAKSLRGEELNNKLKELFGSENKAVPAVKLGALPSPAAIINGNNIIPLDPGVRTGKLANGFTYYIRKNTTPKNRVIFYLANKVGSILENDDQRGLAHFLEHMSFDGTTHFPKNTLIDYLQKSGVRFGADLNAYTSFDETVYQLPLPGDNPEIVNNGVQIMRDWAQESLLDSIDIGKERGVVLEEKRLGKGAAERMRTQYLPVLLNGSRYAQRLPIGTDSVLNNFKYSTLRKFYHDWYRPDLQALIIVGDIDVDQMEKAIREKFADLKNPVNERSRTEYKVSLTGKNQFIAVTDKEQTKTQLEVIIKHQSTTIKTVGDYRQYIIHQLFNSMLASRIAELSANKSKPPFVSAGGGIGELLGGVDTYSVNVVANAGELETGFKAIWRETERIKHFGFTQSELERAKTGFISRRESEVQELSKTNSNIFVNDYLQNFLKGTASPGAKYELELSRLLLPMVTLEGLQKLIDEYIRDTNRDIVLFAPEKDKPGLPGEQTIIQWMSDVAKETITPYQDNFVSKSLLSAEPVRGRIVKETTLAPINATEWTLSNGIKVILKKTDFSANFVLFSAFAPGGNSIYDNSDYRSASNAAFILDRSGIGNYSFNDLHKFFSGKDVFSSTNIEDYDVSLQGGANLKDMETLLQLTYAKFMQPRYDTASFAGVMASFKTSIQNRGNDPVTVFQDTSTALMNNYNVRRANLNMTTLSQIRLDRSYQIYNELMKGNAAAFTFCFSGPFDLEKMRPLVEKYIASLPANNKNIEPRDLGIRPPQGKITKTIYKGTEERASVNLTFSGAYSYSAENNKLLDALKELIQISLISRLRKEESGVYSPSASVTYQKVPNQRYRLRIAFDCAPGNVEKLITAALDEVNKLKTNEPEEVNIEKFKAEDRAGYNQQIKTDFSWLQYIKQQLLNHESLNEINEYDKTLDQVNKESIRAAADKYLSGDNLIRLVLMPEIIKP